MRGASDVILAATTVERSVVDLETGLRGYLIARSRTFLAPYDEARTRRPG